MTIFTAIKYNEGIIIGADRMVGFGNGTIEDRSKFIIKDNFVVAVRGRMLDKTLLSNKSPLWKRLEMYLQRDESYDETVLTLNDFFESINRGQKTMVDFMAITNFLATGKIEEHEEIHASFLCALRYRGTVSLHYDGGYGNLQEHINCRSSILATPEKVDFTPEYVSSKQMAYVKVLERVKDANKNYFESCSGVEIIDFTSKASTLMYQENIN